MEQAGGFYSRYGSSKLINSIVTGNKSGKHGGGIYYNFDIPEIINTTISGNFGGERGGGISIIGGTVLSVKNSVTFDNASPEGNELWVCNTCSLTLDYSLFRNNTNDVYIASGGIVSETNCLHTNP